MKTDLIIIGGGGHAKVLISAIRSSNEFNVKGILDPKLPINTTVCGVPVIGTDEVLLKKGMRECQLIMGFGSMKACNERKKRFIYLKEMGCSFAIVKHSDAVIDESVVIGEGSQIMAGVVIQPETVFGANCIINTSAIVEHDCRISDNVHIAPGTVLGGRVSVGSNSLIGLGSRILPGVKIGTNVTVGAGAVVVKNVGDNVKMIGVPASEVC